MDKTQIYLTYEVFSVLPTGYQMIFEKERERETFGFVYWLPDDIWERERERLSVLYASYQVMFERERFSVCRLFINISCGIISDVVDWIT